MKNPQQTRRDTARRWLLLGTACVVLSSVGTGARAGETDVSAKVEAAAAETGSSIEPIGLGGRLLVDDELGSRRGGTAHNDMRLDGVVGANEATNVVTGANTISSGAFAGTAGLPMVIQNSGNNVLIQNATIINVQIK